MINWIVASVKKLTICDIKKVFFLRFLRDTEGILPHMVNLWAFVNWGFLRGKPLHPDGL